MKKQNWKDLVNQLHRIAIKKGVTQAAISRKTGIKQSAISSFFACRNKPNIETIITISDAIGHKIEIAEKRFA